MWLALAGTIVAPTAGRAAAQDTTGVGSFSGSVVDAAPCPRGVCHHLSRRHDTVCARR
jgi:hypothetical protein